MIDYPACCFPEIYGNCSCVRSSMYNYSPMSIEISGLYKNKSLYCIVLDMNSLILHQIGTIINFIE